MDLQDKAEAAVAIKQLKLNVELEKQKAADAINTASKAAAAAKTSEGMLTEAQASERAAAEVKKVSILVQYLARCAYQCVIVSAALRWHCVYEFLKDLRHVHLWCSTSTVSCLALPVWCTQCQIDVLT